MGIKIDLPCFCDMDKGAGLKLTDTARTLQARYNKGINNHKGEISGVAIPINLKCININDENGKERPQQDRIYAIDGDMTALTSSLGGRHNIAIPVITPDRANKRQNGRRFKENGDPMFTLTAQDRHGVAVEMPEGFMVYAIWYEKEQCYIAIRKLTPKECFRLQGWTDDYFEKAAFVNSDSQLYRQAGNGVSVPVIKAIGERFKDVT